MSEKNYVIEPEPHKFPYGSKITIFLNGEIQFDVEEKSYQLGENLVLKFVKNDTTASKYTEITFPGFQVWDVFLFGFTTACEAERSGIKLAESFLWLSISRNFPIRLLYNKILPCSVYDRTKGPSLEAFGFGHITRKEKSEDIVEEVKKVFFSNYQADIEQNRLLLAMEIFSSSQLEVTERAKFISLITSLESLSEQKSYKEYREILQEKINELINYIKNEENIPQQIRESLTGRIRRDLEEESVRQAILRTVKKFTSQKEDRKLFEKAYDVRSSLVHDGKTSEDLYYLTQDISKMMRRIFSSCFGIVLNKD